MAILGQAPKNFASSKQKSGLIHLQSPKDSHELSTIWQLSVYRWTPTHLFWTRSEHGAFPAVGPVCSWTTVATHEARFWCRFRFCWSVMLNLLILSLSTLMRHCNAPAGSPIFQDRCFSTSGFTSVRLTPRMFSPHLWYGRAERRRYCWALARIQAAGHRRYMWWAPLSAFPGKCPPYWKWDCIRRYDVRPYRFVPYSTMKASRRATSNKLWCQIADAISSTPV